jgi:hypothetical protein
VALYIGHPKPVRFLGAKAAADAIQAASLAGLRTASQAAFRKPIRGGELHQPLGAQTWLLAPVDPLLL